MPHVHSAGARIHYRWDGRPRDDAPVLVLSNSLGTEAGMWDDQLPALAAHFSVLRYDTRGHGKSDATPGDYDIALLGRDVVALLDALELPRVHFCGLSLGGMTGQWLSIHAPQRIERLVLASTSAHVGPRDAWETRIRTVRTAGMRAIADTIIERWFTAAFRSAEPAKTQRIRRMLLDTPPDGYVSCCAAVRDLDLRDALPRISAPALVICGAQDAAIPAARQRELAGAIPSASLAEIPGSHLCNIESADLFDAKVLDFLRE